MQNKIALRPSYWASVSGGKDSLYMLNLILHNLDKYPLTGVVHFELEIDFPFIKNVIDYMEGECKRFGIPFYRIKPTKTWWELYKKYNYPSRVNRWCNSRYKLDCDKQFAKFLKSKGWDYIKYIGYCKDEYKRYEKRTNDRERYPLVEENIQESLILEWAKTQPIFNDYYKFNRRCGCMGCPLSDKMNIAYLAKYYPDHFRYFMDKAMDSEKIVSERLGRKFSVWSSNPKYDTEYLINIIYNKYIPILEREIRKDANQ